MKITRLFSGKELNTAHHLFRCVTDIIRLAKYSIAGKYPSIPFLHGLKHSRYDAPHACDKVEELSSFVSKTCPATLKLITQFISLKDSQGFLWLKGVLNIFSESS